jgi:hypothetical protein
MQSISELGEDLPGVSGNLSLLSHNPSAFASLAADDLSWLDRSCVLASTSLHTIGCTIFALASAKQVHFEGCDGMLLRTPRR